MKDLVILVADKNMQFALRGALARREALGIRAVTFDFRSHMGQGGGVRTTGVDVLALERQRFAHALLVFDLEGCGAHPAQTADDLEKVLDQRLEAHWGTQAKAIVITPEVDIWLWGADVAIREALHWPLGGHVRDWLQQRGFTFDAHGKPAQPKEALEALVRYCKLPRSSALYEKITSRISLKRCADPAFLRMRAVLRTWFAVTD